MMIHEDHTNSLMRTNSNFDTHIAIQSREKYFDKLGLDASVTSTTGSPMDLNTPKLHSRRLSRGLSSVNLSSEAISSSLNPRLSEVSAGRPSNLGRTSDVGLKASTDGANLRLSTAPQSKSGRMMARIS